MSQQQILLGMGAGYCGLELLAEVLGKQPNANISFQQPPLLPWEQSGERPVLKQRLERFKATRSQRFIGDVASFYLPYIEEAWRIDPSIRCICLQRPLDEIVAGFCRGVAQPSALRINHFAKSPALGWDRDPHWSRAFPQYETSDIVEGATRYWHEYYERAQALARQRPDRFLLVDTERLTTPDGVQQILTFCGFPHESHVVVTGRKPAPPANPPTTHLVPRSQNPLDPRRCVVLVPFMGFIHQECEEALKALERRGYIVRRVGGYANIDQGRNQMSTDALMEGFEETLWIDSDVGFNPDDVEKLRAHNLPIVCGIYPQKGKRALASHVMPGAPSMTFGKDGGLVELLYAGTGFLLIRREVYQTVLRQLELPICNERFGHPMIPFFLPMLHDIEEGCWYLGEDYAFCHRARECGFKVFADTSIRLWHIGTYRYGWEDAGSELRRFGSFTLNFNDQSRGRPDAGGDRPQQVQIEPGTPEGTISADLNPANAVRNSGEMSLEN